MSSELTREEYINQKLYRYINDDRQVLGFFNPTRGNL